MADEKLPIDQEDQEETMPEAEAAEELVEEEADEAVDVAAGVEDEAVPADEADGAADQAPELDERVEAAVRHVAEEAEADTAEGPADNKILAEDEAPAPSEAEADSAPKRRERRSKQARAAKAATDDSVSPTPQKASRLASLGVPVWIGIAAASLVLGLVLGRFVLGGSVGGTLSGKIAVTEAQLDDAYATYTYRGKTETISIREAIEQNGTVEAMKDEDGTYRLPAAEYALNAARTAILDKEVESRGIVVSDEDVAAYAEQTLGTSDYESIASAYGMEVDAVRELILENCRMNALREEVVGGTLPEMPADPEAAEEGKEDELTKEYADYIIGLAGDEWDEEAGTWAQKDSRYATALADADFSAEGASYNAAQAAYYVAYQLYTEQQTEMSSTWAEYVNGLMCNASIQVGTLVS